MIRYHEVVSLLKSFHGNCTLMIIIQMIVLERLLGKSRYEEEMVKFYLVFHDYRHKRLSINLHYIDVSMHQMKSS